MSQPEVLFNIGGVSVVGKEADGPRGARVVIDAGAEPRSLLEGEVKQLYRALRGWVRYRKQLRGDTPRGRVKMEERRAQYKTAAAAAPLDSRA